MYRPVKKPVTLRLDADVLEWFRRDGRGYQTRINEALREIMVKSARGRRPTSTLCMFYWVITSLTHMCILYILMVAVTGLVCAGVSVVALTKLGNIGKVSPHLTLGSPVEDGLISSNIPIFNQGVNTQFQFRGLNQLPLIFGDSHYKKGFENRPWKYDGVTAGWPEFLSKTIWPEFIIRSFITTREPFDRGPNFFYSGRRPPIFF